MRAGRAVTMKDVAKASGLSAAAVSLALRGHASIPPATRKRVEEAAAALGYVKNPLLMALTALRSDTEATARIKLAFVAEAASERQFIRGSFPPYYDGFKSRAEALGFEAELVLVSVGESACLAERLVECEAKGCALAGLDPEAWGNAGLASKLPLANLESAAWPGTICSVSVDFWRGALLASQRLRERGYERIGVAIVKTPFPRIAASFGLGADSSLVAELLGESIDMHCIEPNRGSPEQGEGLRRWIERNRLDAVLGDSDEVADILAAGGIAVPGEVAFASLSVTGVSRGVAGIVQPMARIGALAAERLAARAYGARSASTVSLRTALPGEWKDGATAPARVFI